MTKRTANLISIKALLMALGAPKHEVADARRAAFRAKAQEIKKW